MANTFWFLFLFAGATKTTKDTQRPISWENKNKTKNLQANWKSSPVWAEKCNLFTASWDGRHPCGVAGWFALDWFGPRRGGTLEHQELASHRTYATPPPPSRTERKDTLSASLNIHFIMSRHCLLKILLHLPHKVLSTRGSILHIDGYTYNSYHFSTCNLMKWNI